MMKKRFAPNGAIYSIALSMVLVNLFLISCAQPDIIIDEPIEIISTGISSIEVSATIKQEIDIMTVKPIIEYRNYFVEETGKVWGLLDSSVKFIDFYDGGNNPLQISNFTFADGVIYMQFIIVEDEADVEYNFTQIDGKVSAIDKWPDFPEAEQIELNEKPFKIVSGMYQDMNISTVFNGTKQTAFLPITGASVNDKSMWFNVSETFNAMTVAGLYFYKVDSNAPDHKIDKGRLW